MRNEQQREVADEASCSQASHVCRWSMKLRMNRIIPCYSGSGEVEFETIRYGWNYFVVKTKEVKPVVVERENNKFYKMLQRIALHVDLLALPLL